MSKQFTILTCTVICYLASDLSSLEFPLHLASLAWTSGPTCTSSMQPVYVCVCVCVLGGWRGRSQCSGLSQAQVQRVLCLSLGPRPSSPEQQMDYITATFNLSLSVVVMYSIWCCSELNMGQGLLLPGPFLSMAIGQNHKAWH